MAIKGVRKTKDYYHYKGRKHTYTYILCILAIVLLGASIYRVVYLINNSGNKNVAVDEHIHQDVESLETINIKDGEDKNTIVLVNKEKCLEDNYVPKDIVELNTDFISNGDPGVNKLCKVAAIALEELFIDAAKDNIYLLGVSGYRDYNYQKTLYESEVAVFGRQEANRYVAKPGESEHQTGLAMDVLSQDYQTLDVGFRNTKAYSWLEQNCANYGFIIRYPEGKEDITGYQYEPWHIRYVGIEAAKEIMQEDITLEEYLDDK